MASSRLTLFKEALKKALVLGLTGTARVFFKSLREGKSVDLLAVDVILEGMQVAAVEQVANIGIEGYSKALKLEQPNLLPLRALLQERQTLIEKAVRGHRFIFDQSVAGSLRIGRKGQDVLREMTLQELEKAFIGKSPAHILRKEFVKKLVDKGILVDPDSPERELRNIQAEFFDKMPIFRRDGRLKFFLQNKNGDFMAFDAQYYADLVAISTTEEAREVATEERARDMGTRFVKFNTTGKPAMAYVKDGDEQCARIDGNVFSVVKETQQGGKWGAIGQSGKFYLHKSEVITSGFAKPHPFCRHRSSPHPERLT